MVKELKDFLLKGNIVELAIGLLIAVAFGALITAFIDTMVSPLLGMFLGKTDFSALTFEINNAVFMIGTFINALIAFVVTGIVLFLMLRAYNNAQKPAAEEVVVDEPSEDVILLREIRDALRTRA